MLNAEMITFLGYFILLFFVAMYFFFNGGNRNQEDYFLGGRSMGPWVTAMSAQASDMSAWLLMGLPGSIMAFGFGQMWIGIGLTLGTAANWIFCAKRLRKFSKAANDAITLPQSDHFQNIAGSVRRDFFTVLHHLRCIGLCGRRVGIHDDISVCERKDGDGSVHAGNNRLYFFRGL